MRRVLVTGGAGFIGSHIVDTLMEEGCFVRVLDNLSTGTRENINGKLHEVDFIEGDILDRTVLENVCNGIDILVHAAGSVSIQQSLEEPEHFHQVNVVGSTNAFEVARNAGVKKIIFLSSCATYGNIDTVPISENEEQVPLSPYGQQKKIVEEILHAIANESPIEVFSLRLFNVYGPRQSIKQQHAAVVPSFIQRILSGEAPVIHGDGTQTRDFVYVGDVASVVQNIAKGVQTNGGYFNIGSERETTLTELAQHINKTLGKNTQPVFYPARTGEIKRSCGNIERARRELHFTPTPLEVGLKKTVAGWKDYALT